MKFGDFLFPESSSKETDHIKITEALQEAELCDELGLDAIWLAEHHFDGGCAYVDPTTFASAIAVRTKRIKIGFAVAQMALHHPVRLAEQVALLDVLSQGRMILGLGRGTAFNWYEYRGYGIAPEEAYERLDEAEEMLFQLWTTDNYDHQGKYWQVTLPELRPKAVQQPHPPIIRGASSLESTLDMARRGRPFLMNVQSVETTGQRLDAFKDTMAEAGYDEQTIAQTMDDCWVWRNVVVADTDAEAESIGLPAFTTMRQNLSGARERLNLPSEQTSPVATTTAARDSVEQGLICGSPDTVAEKLDKVARTGAGGVIIHFRLGPLPWEANANSLRLFANKVVPQLETRATS